jgi:hypothetical protein
MVLVGPSLGGATTINFALTNFDACVAWKYCTFDEI